MIKKILLSVLMLCFVTSSCTQKAQNKQAEIPRYEQQSPDFNADNAYNYIQQQLDFGARVPNTKAHTTCGDYLISKLKEFGAELTEQKMVLTAFDGTKLNSRNIIATYGADKTNRVLLFAHWDTRPFSDHDVNKENYNTPVQGANDGGSGVGVLLEIARNLNLQKPNIGVDIILFDSEDYGPPADQDKEGDWWCLGSQYWSKNPHIKGHKANFGILLDMVGALDARFYHEYYSLNYAKSIVNKVWSRAHQLGYNKYFVAENGSGVVDDHLYINQIARIPSIDIIQFDSKTETGFGDYWHTQKDDMSNISKETLKAVGQTVMEVIYTEK